MIRPATDADIPHLVEMARAYFTALPYRDGLGVFDAGLSWETIEEAISEDSQHMLVFDDRSGWIWTQLYRAPWNADLYASVRAFLVTGPRGWLLLRRAMREAKSAGAVLFSAHHALTSPESEAVFGALGLSPQIKSYVRLL